MLYMGSAITGWTPIDSFATIWFRSFCMTYKICLRHKHDCQKRYWLATFGNEVKNSARYLVLLVFTLQQGNKRKRITEDIGSTGDGIKNAGSDSANQQQVMTITCSN